ncbi:hypothetical protein H257_18879, partial [Aphanomyces astaci]
STPSLNAWFLRHLRCSRFTYLRIVEHVQTAWQRIHPALHQLSGQRKARHRAKRS